jgi:hypothetical protein
VNSDQVTDIMGYIFDSAKLSDEYIAMQGRDVATSRRLSRCKRECAFFGAVWDTMQEEARERARDERLGGEDRDGDAA